jgi:hypothetical protein
VQKAIRYGLIAIAGGLIIAVGVLVAAFSDANDHIDRCSDPTSGTYIFDPDRRQAECS